MDRQASRSLPTLEFTYDWYREFLERLQGAGFDFRTFANGVGPGDVLLRHDVDLSVDRALTMARIEAERGVRATYCILLTSALYNPLERERREQVREIEELGHEVALHFSTHAYWDADDRPDDAALAERIADERETLGTVLSAAPETVSFHIPPSWVLDRSFDEVRNTYASAYFSDIEYVADSGQRWRETPPAVVDPPSSAQILIHPGLWGETDADFEACVERSVSGACHHAGRSARREFLQEACD